MSDVYSDAYWKTEFEVTTADLERIAQRIRETSSAYELTELTKRVVRGRLRHGPETSAPAQPVWADDHSVRLWDPAGKWQQGDHVIVAVGFPIEGRTVHEPFVGEVTLIGSNEVTVLIDALDDSKTYKTQAGPGKLEQWRRLVENLVKARRGTKDVETQTEYVILEHGERVASQLLDALRANERFVRLAGRWFLRQLAAPPTDEQLTTLAWAMVSLEEPQPTAELVPLVQPSLAQGDPGLFGIYLAMRNRPDLFANADPEQRPRWVLAGPPPGTFTPRYAAYDPETYEVLCLSGEPASPEVTQRLWSLDLLRAVVGET